MLTIPLAVTKCLPIIHNLFFYSQTALFYLPVDGEGTVTLQSEMVNSKTDEN